VYVHSSTFCDSFDQVEDQLLQFNGLAAVAVDETQHVIVELTVGDYAGDTGVFRRTAAIDVDVRAKGEGRYVAPIRLRQARVDHVPGDSAVHIDNANRHRVRLAAQRTDKCFCRGDEATFETQLGQDVSNARPEEQIAVQDNGKAWSGVRGFTHGCFGSLPGPGTCLIAGVRAALRHVRDTMLRSTRFTQIPPNRIASPLR
jgi:hypothetical protein